MSYRTRLFKYALGGCLALSVLMLLVGKGDAYGNSSYPSDEARKRLDLAEQIAAVQNVANAERYNPGCEAPKNREDDDLCQQKRMAKAAEDAVWWAKLQTFIAIFGAGGLALTLILTARATRAATQQVRLSRQTLVSTDRAFVFVSEGLLNPVIDAKADKVVSWKTGVRWKNSGNTPTRYLRLYIAARISDQALPDDFDFPAKEVPDVHVLIAPGGTIDSVELPVTLEQMDGVLDGSLNLHVWGWAEYDDIFDSTPRHRTEFCFRWTVGGNIRHKTNFGTRYNIHNRHNAADEECENPIVTASPKDLGRR